MKNLEQQPMPEDKKLYIDNEDKLATLKAKPVENLSMEEFQELKKAKAENTALSDKAEDEGRAEDAERTGSKITENISKADIREKAEKAMRSMTGNMGEWAHLPDDAREVLAKLKDLMIKPDAKLGKNEDWTESFKDLSEIDFAQVNEIVDGFNKEVAEAEENKKKFEIRKEAEDVLRSMTGLMGEWEHLPEDARDVRAKLVDLLMQEGTTLDGEKKWTNNFKSLNEIDFEQVKAIVAGFKQEVADEKAATELTERIKSGKIGDTTETKTEKSVEASDGIEDGGEEKVESAAGDNVNEKSWKGKTWKEIQVAPDEAATKEDRARLMNDRMEAWHALKDLEGASPEQLEAAKKDAERNIQISEESLRKPMGGSDSTHPVFDTPEKQARREEARSETLKDLEGWKKRLNSINEVINR